MPDTPAIENISHCFKIAFKDTLKGMIEILGHKFRAQEDTNEGKQEALARSIAKALRPTLTTQAPEVSTELVLTPLDIIINDIHTMGTDNGNKFYHFIVKQLTNNKSSAELDALLDTQAHEILHGWHGVFIWMAHKFQFEPESMHAAASHLGAVAGIKVFTYYVHTKCSLFDHIDQLPEALYFRSFEGDNPSSQLQKLINAVSSMTIIDFPEGILTHDHEARFTANQFFSGAGIVTPKGFFIRYDSDNEDLQEAETTLLIRAHAKQFRDSDVPVFGYVQLSSMRANERGGFTQHYPQKSEDYTHTAAWKFRQACLHAYTDIETIEAYLTALKEKNDDTPLPFKTWFNAEVFWKSLPESAHSMADRREVTPMYRGNFQISAPSIESLKHSSFKHVDFSHSRFIGNQSAEEPRFVMPNFSGAKLSHCHMEDIKASDKVFDGSNLDFSHFTCSELNDLAFDAQGLSTQYTQFFECSLRRLTLPETLRVVFFTLATFDNETERTIDIPGEIESLPIKEFLAQRDNSIKSAIRDEMSHMFNANLHSPETQNYLYNTVLEVRKALVGDQVVTPERVQKIEDEMAEMKKQEDAGLLQPGIFTNLERYLSELKRAKKPIPLTLTYRDDKSGTDGAHGLDGENGTHGQAFGEKGSNGNPGTPGTSGTNAGAIDLVLQRYVDGTRFFVSDRVGYAGGKPTFLKTIPQSSLICKATGGNGGNGGRGGNGGDGHLGRAGNNANAKTSTPAGDGTNGGDAGSGSHGSIGGHGGDGGQIAFSLAQQDIDLTLLVETPQCHGGKSGLGGDGGEKGEPGKGGPGGAESKYTKRTKTGTDSDGRPIYDYNEIVMDAGHPGTSGTKGSPGKPGNNGIQGKHGQSLFTVFYEDGSRSSYKSPFEIVLTSFSLSGSPDGIIEPGERIFAHTFVFENRSDMPTPHDGIVRYSLKAAHGIDKNPNSSDQVAISDLVESEKVKNENPIPLLISNLPFGHYQAEPYYRTVQPDFEGKFYSFGIPLRTFTDHCTPMPRQVRFPIELSKFCCYSSIAPGYQIPIAMKLRNISLSSIGIKRGRYLGLNLLISSNQEMPTDSVIFATNYDGKQRRIPLDTNVRLPIDTIDGGEVLEAVGGSLYFESDDLPHYSALTIRCQLEIGTLDAPLQHTQVIQQGMATVGITETYASDVAGGAQNMDVLLVIHSQTKLSDIEAWKALCEKYALVCCVWNVSLQGPFHYDRADYDFPAQLKDKTIIIDNSSFYDPIENKKHSILPSMHAHVIADAAKNHRIHTLVLANTSQSIGLEKLFCPKAEVTGIEKHHSRKALFKAVKERAGAPPRPTSVTHHKTLLFGSPTPTMLEAKIAKTQQHLQKHAPDTSFWKHKKGASKLPEKRYLCATHHELGEVQWLPGLMPSQAHIIVDTDYQTIGEHHTFALLKLLSFDKKLAKLTQSLAQNSPLKPSLEALKKAVISDLLDELNIMIQLQPISKSQSRKSIVEGKFPKLSLLLSADSLLRTSNAFTDMLTAYKHYMDKRVCDKNAKKNRKKLRNYISRAAQGTGVSSKVKRKASLASMQLTKKDSIQTLGSTLIDPHSLKQKHLIADHWHTLDTFGHYPHHLEDPINPIPEHPMKRVSHDETQNQTNRDRLASSMARHVGFFRSPEVKLYTEEPDQTHIPSSPALTLDDSQA